MFELPAMSRRAWQVTIIAGFLSIAVLLRVIEPIANESNDFESPESSTSIYVQITLPLSVILLLVALRQASPHPR